MLRSFFSYNYAKVCKINARYATPNVEMSKWVKFSLLSLRFYLIFLIGLLMYKFITFLK